MRSLILFILVQLFSLNHAFSIYVDQEPIYSSGTGVTDIYGESNKYLIKYFNVNINSSKSKPVLTSDKLKIGDSCTSKNFFIRSGSTADVCVSFAGIRDVNGVIILSLGCKYNPSFIGYFKIENSNVLNVVTRYQLLDSKCYRGYITLLAFIQTSDNKVFGTSRIIYIE